ncbi:histidine kinase [Gordonia sp. TBRC 11910]|uniref:histidine kinase n=1 Tax=Gordonia asplenii TaxID=2725283 RepID=A0A848L0K9_9ACTN|nr:histidine kinase [Gordonia asplenii]NMO02021.1 histidine kinase [Gordonia asplenii]
MTVSGLAVVRRSLERQSLLVGVLAAVVDVAVFVSSGIVSAAPLAGLTMSFLLAAADLTLAARPRTTAAVAVIQVMTRIAACLLLSRYGAAGAIGDVGILVAGYRAGAWLSDRASTVVVPVLVAGVSGAALINGAAHSWWMVLAIAVSNAVIPWLVGRYTAAGGAYVTKLELQRQRNRADLERALADEREAIARDLHDVISHHVSAIGIHAGAARMALPTDAEASIRSLRAVETSSRAAMMDLRRQLDLLHGRSAAGDRQPGLADIAELVDSVRRTGLSVELDLPSSAVHLPASLDVTVYRIVQELLTNALRHGDGTARLQIRSSGAEISIVETNSVAAQAYTGESSHRGLDGIRRRAQLFDGRVECGPDPLGAWRSAVTIPIGAT